MTKITKVLLIILLAIGCVVGGLYIHAAVTQQEEPLKRKPVGWKQYGSQGGLHWVVPD